MEVGEFDAEASAAPVVFNTGNLPPSTRFNRGVYTPSGAMLIVGTTNDGGVVYPYVQTGSSPYSRLRFRFRFPPRCSVALQRRVSR